MSLHQVHLLTTHTQLLRYLNGPMVGGMVPPFATAIGTTFFKNKYTQEERRAGVSNWY